MNSLESPRPILAARTRGCMELLLPHILSKGIEIEGNENMLKDGPGIIAVNHMGWAEVLPPMLLSPKQPIPVIKTETVESDFLGKFAEAFRSIGIQKNTSDRDAMNMCVDALKQNNILIVFPEGTRGDTEQEQHELKRGLPGMVLMAQKVAIATEKKFFISPWAIYGTEGILPRLEDKTISWKDRLSLVRAKIHIAVAPPFEMTPTMARDLTKEHLLQYTEQIMLNIRDRLPERYHGYYRGIPNLRNTSGKI
jgi:1-acyl-sn-glycerol-3-phosphate acyltransferase